MTWHTEEGEETAIVRVEGSPSHPDKPVDRSWWEWFKEFMSPKLKRGSDLSGVFVAAKNAQETSKAAKLANEAAMIAVETEAKELENIGSENKLIDDIFADDGLAPEAKKLKLANLVAKHPELLAQLEIVTTLLDKLHLQKGMSIQPLEEVLDSPQLALPGELANEE